MKYDNMSKMPKTRPTLKQYIFFSITITIKVIVVYSWQLSEIFFFFFKQVETRAEEIKDIF